MCFVSMEESDCLYLYSSAAPALRRSSVEEGKFLRPPLKYEFSFYLHFKAIIMLVNVYSVKFIHII